MCFFKIKENSSFIKDDNRIYTYSDLINQYNIYQKLCLKKALVLILASNNFETLSFYYYFFEKFPILLLDQNADKEFIKIILKNYKPKYIVSSLKQIEFNEIYKINHTAIYETKFFIPKIHKKISLLINTSGSTGSQKFVKLSYDNIADNTLNIIKYLKIKNNDKMITTMPFAYSYGLSIINTHLKQNSSIILTNRSILEREFWSDFVNFKITNLNGVPKFWDIILKLNPHKILNDNIKFITQAGGALSKNTDKELSKFCVEETIKFYKMYGQTEASPRISYLDHKFCKTKIGSIGKPLPGGKIDIKNGEIVYYGKNIFGGYSLNFKDLNKFKLNKILKTGDLGYKDKDGFIYINGRKKRIFKLNGLRYSLDEIEKKINNQINGECAIIQTNDILTLFFNEKNDIKNIYLLLTKNFKIEKKVFKLKKIKKYHSIIIIKSTITN